MIQNPPPDAYLLRWHTDRLAVSLKLDAPQKGRAVLRTNLSRAAVDRGEIIAETEDGITPLERAWTDIPLEEIRPGEFATEVELGETGVFSGKTCFFPDGGGEPIWPQGGNFTVKVGSSLARSRNAIYTVFPRQFGSFREVVRKLPFIMGEMGFNIIQTLPPFPVPVTYAVMGEYGCPFAATDFFSVDPAMAEFDERATPLDQFRELIGAVHALRGRIFIDLPANHTGWASTLQTHHPEWFNRAADGRFISPGAWGVTWADLVELDYSNARLCEYMAEVFLFWCRNGVDGFRCDAGYMIPAATWRYIAAKVRDEYPDTVFMLEGLGGELKLTDTLLSEAGLDWAYSEIFQTYDRGQFEWYLPGAIERSEKFGTLVHFAETHDNDRLAKGGEAYARLRVQLAALLSWQGAWGIANGVEWYCREKIDVHGRNSLGWGAPVNMVGLISKLNFILSQEPSFSGAEHLEVVTRGDGNTLAVRRSNLLVLANLDCSSPVSADFDRGRVPEKEGFDLLSERRFDISGSVRLAPGEVLCLKLYLRRFEDVSDAVECGKAPLFKVEMPRDARREICAVAGEILEISAKSHFRAQIIDPADGRTLAVRRSVDEAVRLEIPEYVGDGTRCRRLQLAVSVYENGRAESFATSLLISPPPEKAAVAATMDGAEVRRSGDRRAILSNGAGAAAQVRAGWGEIYSQYDAVLAANPDPNVPSDRLNLWARTRIWLQREGYSREFDRRLVSRFSADPAGSVARWEFAVPAGTGLEAAFVATLQLSPGENAARLKVSRVSAGENDAGGTVRLVFRPDIEWRSFHEPTKAFTGLERIFPAAVRSGRSGFEFSPYGRAFRFSVKGGEFHEEAQWTYNVAHPEEAERGLTPAADLFSPGWISADLEVGGETQLIGSLGEGVFRFFEAARPPEKLPLAEALSEAMKLFIVRRDELKTVIAGYPWFLDWGRDTFIFMRGMIAAGMRGEAFKILKAFAAFEERGTLPNIIYGGKAGNRDTVDAPLWFIRAVQELGREDAALRRVCESIVDNYIAGTPNGIRVDADSALVWSPSHFTWMDTNYPAMTPRIGYPVDIQALWISALKFLGRDELARKATDSVKRLFRWEKGYRDCLSAPGGESAAAAKGEDTVRPNQLLLVTLGVVDDRSIVEAAGELTVPGGIRSLNAGHPLYRGTYTGDENTSRKPSYHNGTVWAWPMPAYAEALAALGMCSNGTALGILAGAVENLNTGCLCHMSEIADGDAPHTQKGCTAQAWSVSEFLRVWLKLGGTV